MAIKKAGPGAAQLAAETKLSTGLKAESRLLNVAAKVLAAASRPDTVLPKAAATLASRFAGGALDALAQLLQTRFDAPASKATVAGMNVAGRQLSKAAGTLRQARNQLEAKAESARLPPGAEETQFRSHHVDGAAEQLAEEASAKGRPVFADFNGTNLIAKPGDSAQQVVDGWRDAQKAISDTPLSKTLSKVSSLDYKVESRATEEAARREVASLVDTPARDPAAIIADVARPDGEYMIQSMCKLKHPGEIKAITEHAFADALGICEGGPAAGDPAAATAMVADNMKSWVNERDGAQRGTKEVWNQAIDDALAANIAPVEGGVDLGVGAGRPLDELKQAMEAENPRNYILGGLCELEHHGEINTWVQHHLDVAPEIYSDAAGGDAGKATDVALKNMLFWVNARGGAAPGSDGAWNDAIEQAMQERGLQRPADT